MNHPVTGGPPAEPAPMCHDCPVCGEENEMRQAKTVVFNCQNTPCNSTVRVWWDGDGWSVDVIHDNYDGAPFELGDTTWDLARENEYRMREAYKLK